MLLLCRGRRGTRTPLSDGEQILRDGVGVLVDFVAVESVDDFTVAGEDEAVQVVPLRGRAVFCVVVYKGGAV